jgi:hypothetical protein
MNDGRRITGHPGYASGGAPDPRTAATPSGLARGDSALITFVMMQWDGGGYAAAMSPGQPGQKELPAGVPPRRERRRQRETAHGVPLKLRRYFGVRDSRVESTLTCWRSARQRVGSVR